MKREFEQTLTVLGALHWDSFFEVDHFPEMGECVVSSKVWQRPGGKGANQAFYAAQCGAPTKMLGWVGNDEPGRKMTDALAEVGVDVRGVRCSQGVVSGLSSVWIDRQSRDYRAVIVSGANQNWTVSQVEQALESTAEGSWLLLQYEVPLATVQTAAEFAHERGVKVMLNAAPFQRLEEVFPCVDVLILNEVEASQLLASEGVDVREPSKMASYISNMVPRVVITLGAQGLVYRWDGEQGQLPARRVDVADSHGAGDSFVGALAASLFLGRTVNEALDRALAVASYVVQHSGPRHWLPRI